MVAGSSPARGANNLNNLPAILEVLELPFPSRATLGGNIRKISRDAPEWPAFWGASGALPRCCPGRLSMPLPAPELTAGGRSDLGVLRGAPRRRGGRLRPVPARGTWKPRPQTRAAPHMVHACQWARARPGLIRRVSRRCRGIAPRRSLGKFCSSNNIMSKQ